jgi:hypothetical protein
VLRGFNVPLFFRYAVMAAAWKARSNFRRIYRAHQQSLDVSRRSRKNKPNGLRIVFQKVFISHPPLV